MEGYPEPPKALCGGMLHVKLYFDPVILVSVYRMRGKGSVARDMHEKVIVDRKR